MYALVFGVVVALACNRMFNVGPPLEHSVQQFACTPQRIAPRGNGIIRDVTNRVPSQLLKVSGGLPDTCGAMASAGWHSDAQILTIPLGDVDSGLIGCPLLTGKIRIKVGRRCALILNAVRQV